MSKAQIRLNKYFTFMTDAEYVQYHMTALNYKEYMEFLPDYFHDWQTNQVHIIGN